MELLLKIVKMLLLNNELEAQDEEELLDLLIESARNLKDCSFKC